MILDDFVRHLVRNRPSAVYIVNQMLSAMDSEGTNDLKDVDESLLTNGIDVFDNLCEGKESRDKDVNRSTEDAKEEIAINHTTPHFVTRGLNPAEAYRFDHGDVILKNIAQQRTRSTALLK